MNIPAILETARRIRENDLPFEFNMGKPLTCIMQVAYPQTRTKWCPSKSADALGVDKEQANALFFPINPKCGNTTQIPTWRAADTLDRLARTGRVEWDWSAPEIALVIVTPAQKHGV